MVNKFANVKIYSYLCIKKNETNMNDYVKKYVDAFKSAKTDEEIAALVDKIYQEGFEDAVQFGGEEC